MRANPVYPKNLPEVVMIPFWVAEALNRAKLSVKECLDYEKIKPALSMEDLASFYNCQPLLGNLTDCPNDIMLTSNLRGLWERSIPTDRPEVTAELQKFISEMCPVFGNYGQTEERLFGEDRRVERYTEPFKIVDLGEKLIGVIVHPGFFGKATIMELQALLVRAILKAFNMYNSYSEVATSPLFKRHLELLQGGYAE